MKKITILVLCLQVLLSVNILAHPIGVTTHQSSQQLPPPPPPPPTQEIEMLVVEEEEEIEQTSINEERFDDDDDVFIVVENMPEFPGGQQALFQYLSEHVKYPIEAFEKGIQGRVILQFVVEKDGNISDVHVIRSGGDISLDGEAVRVISAMPKWKPGMQKGKCVRVKYTVPVNFRLADASNQ